MKTRTNKFRLSQDLKDFLIGLSSFIVVASTLFFMVSLYL